MVVTVSPDERMAPHPGIDGGLGIPMGHVVLKEVFVDRQVPRFVDYVKLYGDLPFVVRLKKPPDPALRPAQGADGAAQVPDALVPDTFVTAAERLWNSGPC